MKKCPFCAEEIQDEAIKCRYCGEFLKPGCVGNRFVSDGLTYEIGENETLSLCSGDRDGAVLIPSTVDHEGVPYSVTSIGEDAFGDRYDLTSVTIPESVTSIGDGAFVSCSSLTSISIPDSVLKIGESAFMGCSDLTSISIPDSVKKIGDNGFMDCPSLTSIDISDSVTSIGEFTFSGCRRLRSITIPRSVKKIGESAFRDCHSLTSITIPRSVKKIGESAFRGCNNLTSITIPDSVATLARAAGSFDDDASLPGRLPRPANGTSRHTQVPRSTAVNNEAVRDLVSFGTPHSSANAAMVCPHCSARGSVRTQIVTRKSGISGGKATAAVLTGGLSVLATGLSAKETKTQATCGNCGNTWYF